MKPTGKKLAKTKKFPLFPIDLKAKWGYNIIELMNGGSLWTRLRIKMITIPI